MVRFPYPTFKVRLQEFLRTLGLLQAQSLNYQLILYEPLQLIQLQKLFQALLLYQTLPLYQALLSYQGLGSIQPQALF